MSLIDCKSRTPQEALENFEEAVRHQEQYLSDVNQYGESELDFTETQSAYEAAKAELLIWMSYIP